MSALAVSTFGLYALASWRLGRGGERPDESASRGVDPGFVVGSLAIVTHLALHVLAWRHAGGADLRFFAALSLVALLAVPALWTHARASRPAVEG